MEGRLFKFPILQFPNSASLRTLCIYLSGALYSLGFWLLIDASVYSKKVNASIVHVSFIDWIPFICSTLGMIVVNSLDKIDL